MFARFACLGLGAPLGTILSDRFAACTATAEHGRSAVVKAARLGAREAVWLGSHPTLHQLTGWWACPACDGRAACVTHVGAACGVVYTLPHCGSGGFRVAGRHVHP